MLEPARAQIDLRTLWFLLNEGRRQAAQEELQRLRNAFPDWEPDADLRAALNPQTAAPRDPYGEEMASLAELADEALRALPAARLAAAARSARERGDGDNLHMLGWRHLIRDEPAAGLAAFEEAASAGGPRDREGIIAALTALAAQASAAGEVERVAALARRSQEEEGPDLLLDQAWAQREAGRLANAEALFRAALPAAVASEGLALTLRDRGEPGSARDIACDAAQASASLAQLCTSWLDEAQAAAYSEGDFRGVLALQQRREALPASVANPGDSAALVAWSYYALDEREAAAAAFNEQLAQTPDDEGMASALLNLLRDDRGAREAAARQHPTVARVMRRNAGAVALARKQFDRAAYLEADAALAHRDALSLTLDANRRYRSGERGLGQLTHERAALTISAMHDDWRLGTTLGWSDFHSGRPGPDAAFGSRPGNSGEPFDTLARVSEPSVHVWARRELDSVSLYGSIGRDLWQQPAGETITALLQARFFTDPVSSRIELFQQPIADSLLSRSGVIDPVDGAAWGGVVDRGIAGQSTWSTASDWHLSINGSLSQQVGENVRNNHALSGRVDLRSGWPGRRWGESMDYWQLGAFASWRGFDENQFVFVRDRGGYFSPQDEYRVGLSTELLTAEGRRWQLRAGLEVAWTDITEAATPVSIRQETRGINVDARLQGHWLLTPHLQLGASLQATDALGFRGNYAGLTLRWFPQPRKAVWSRELQIDHRE